jgi:hypothetical protein
MSLANPDRVKMCSKHHVHAEGKCSTEYPSKPLSASLTPSEPSEAQEPTYALTGLSYEDVSTCLRALANYGELYQPGSTTADRVESIMEQLNKLSPVHDEYECMHYDDGCRCQCSDCK